MPFFGKRPQRFGQHLQLCHLHAWLTRFGEETLAFDANKIAEIQKVKDLHRRRAQFLGLDVNLKPPTGIAQVEEMTLSHVAVGGDAPGQPDRLSFLKFLTNLANRSARVESSAERFDGMRPQSFQLGAAL